MSDWEVIEQIRKLAVKDRTVAFFCPDEAFRKNFGEVPRLLRERGHVVLLLYGKRLGDEYEADPFAYQVGGGLIGHVEGVDLFITATSMDVLPNESKKGCLIHGSMAPFWPDPYEPTAEVVEAPASNFRLRYRRAVDARKHFAAFARIFDCYFVATDYFKSDFMRPLLAESYRLGAREAAPSAHEHFVLFTQDLKARGIELPERIQVAPIGYPQVDALMRRAADSRAQKDTITYAPTPLHGKRIWEKYSSLVGGGADILEVLLERFGTHRVVFKPHASDLDHPATAAILERFSGHPRLVVDTRGSSYHELYARTAIMVSDFSSTAYTFALGTLCPVIFHSPAEQTMPAGLRAEAYCALRTEVGVVVDTVEGFASAVTDLLRNSGAYRDKIERFRDQFLFNPGRSDEAFVDAIVAVLEGKTAPGADVYDNRAPYDDFPQTVIDAVRRDTGPQVLVDVFLGSFIVRYAGWHLVLPVGGGQVDLALLDQPAFDAIPRATSLTGARWRAFQAWLAGRAGARGQAAMHRDQAATRSSVQ